MFSFFDVVLLLLVASCLIGLGFFLGRRSAAQSRFAFPMETMAQQRMYDRDGLPPAFPQQGMYGAGYGMGYPMQQGMNPLAAGGLGAIGGGLLGYQLGQTMATQEPPASDAQFTNMQESSQDSAAQMNNDNFGNSLSYDSMNMDVGGGLGDIETW